AECLAGCYWRRRMWPEVIAWLETFGPKAEESIALPLAYAYFQQGMSLVDTDPAHAIELWRSVHRLAPASDLSRTAIEQCIERGRIGAFRAWGSGNLEEVIRYASAVVDLTHGESESEFSYVLLEAYVCNEKFEEALELT